MSKTPEHLTGLEEILNKYPVMRPDEAKYAEIAFDLLKAGEGDKEALSKVSEYIQQQHKRAKTNYEYITGMKTAISSWILWATNWTVRKKENVA